MKAKKPLLLAVLVIALLAVALIVPAIASGQNDDRPGDRVTGNYEERKYDANGDLRFQRGFTINVGESGDGSTLMGFVLQKLMYSTNPLVEGTPVVRRATEFVVEDSYWSEEAGLAEPYLDNYARFYRAGEHSGWAWSDFFPDIGEDLFLETLLGGFPDLTPTNLAGVDLNEANIADFVISVPSFGPAESSYLWPHRYVVLDFDEPGREDLVQLYGWVQIIEPIPDFLPNGYGIWWPSLLDDGDYIPETDLVHVPAGNFQVHVEPEPTED